MQRTQMGLWLVVVGLTAWACGGDSAEDEPAAAAEGGAGGAGAGGGAAGGSAGKGGTGGASAGAGGASAGAGGASAGAGGASAGAGGGGAGGAGGAGGMNPQCGSAPYANWKKGRSRDILFASATPQTTIYASLCPAPLVVTDGSGMSGPIDVAANTPFWFLGTAAGYHPSATVEMKWPLGSSSSQLDLDMFPVSKAPVSDGYAGSSPSAATIWVALTAAPTATCTVAG